MCDEQATAAAHAHQSAYWQQMLPKLVSKQNRTKQGQTTGIGKDSWHGEEQLLVTAWK
jgi:hypothetical protein